MHNRRNLLPVSPLITRFEHSWRPSRWQCAAQLLLGVLAVVAVLNCALSLFWAAPLAVIALCIAVFQAWNDWRKPAQKVLIPLPPGCACIDQLPLQSIALVERGPLCILRYTTTQTTANTARGQLLFWPDTLLAAQRRALRLAVHAHAQCDQRQIMAP